MSHISHIKIVCLKTWFARMLIIFLYMVEIVFAFGDAKAEANREIRAGIFNFEGYHSKDEHNNLVGYGMDLLSLLSEYSHLNFTFTGFEHSWKDMLDMLEKGDIDIVSSARKTHKREDKFAFSLPVGRNQTVLSKRIYNSKIRAGDYSTYDGMKIGVLAGSSQNAYLEPFAKEKGFSYSIREYTSPRAMTKALEKGEVDAILSSNLRKPEDETVLNVLHNDNFYVIARKEDQKLIDEINRAIEQMNINEGDWQNDIYYRHYGPEISNRLKFSQREKDYIEAVKSGKKTITALSRPDIPPYSYLENGTLHGILPDYFARAMDIARLPYKMVVPEDSEDYAKIAAEGNPDVILDQIRPEYGGEDSSFHGFTTEPYLVSGLARVMKRGFKGQPKTIALPDKLPLAMQASLLEDVDVRHYPSPHDAMTAVQNGEADAAYVLPYTAQMFVNRDFGNNLYYTMMNDPGASFRMFVPVDADHELITILKKSIRGLPVGTLGQLGSSYVSVNADEMSIMHYLHANPGLSLGIAIAAMLTGSLIFFMWLHGRWNKRILATTEYANHQLESQLAIVEALSRDYSNVLAISPDSSKTRIIKIFGHETSGKPESQKESRAYDEILETYIKQKVHPDDRARITKTLALPAIREKLADRDEYTGIYRLVENGETQFYQYTFVRHHKSDAKNQDLILAGFRNIDEVIRREQQQKRRLKEALAQARYASAAKTAFLNNMSHDIRTPMNAIIGFTTLAASNVRNAPMVQRYLGKIMTSGNHLLSLINDVLDMSRIESGKVKIEEQEVRLPDIMRDLRTIAQADVKAKQLGFQINTLNVTNETIFCDRLRLNQILLNILSNAIKYTPPAGKVSVHVMQTGKPEDGYANYAFSVRDTGIGMSSEFLKHVFEPFEREQTTTVSGIQGTGLGLAITKKIVDMMGGTIDVQSAPDKGSEFTVSFKFRIGAEDGDIAGAPEFAGARALIVAEDPEACAGIGAMLSSLDMRPDWTTLGEEALVRAQSAVERKEPFQVFFIDGIMEDMNGLELARRLRKIVGKDAPIFLMTAYDWTDIEEEGREAGITAFISKPVFGSELKKILSKSGRLEEVEKPNQHPEIFQGRHILLAEDNEMNQEIAQMILEDAGFKLDIVENGQEAVDKIKTMPLGYYDLILMDVQMPLMNGYEATRAIRGLEDVARSTIPIIAMTANAFDEDREEAINSGMNGYVAKPIDIGKLMETLQNVLAQKNAQ